MEIQRESCQGSEAQERNLWIRESLIEASLAVVTSLPQDGALLRPVRVSIKITERRCNMSAISFFRLNNALIMPCAGCESDRVNAGQDNIRYAREPVIAARWTVEIDAQGRRQLVEHWFKSQRSPK